ncbi:hypothetical protein ARMSODRAFT_1006610 [Armillaria solidipes]|uniref:Uncharacterized protein n=1 Tax=Armillaria solidipes TaxID=1076256 RepID=A0A2H3BEQ2_9AGAR|nr:hypothetical protein ARMSODRAFT_1006610 [Armillaria solidipes]
MTLRHPCPDQTVSRSLVTISEHEEEGYAFRERKYSKLSKILSRPVTDRPEWEASSRSRPSLPPIQDDHGMNGKEGRKEILLVVIAFFLSMNPNAIRNEKNGDTGAVSDKKGRPPLQNEGEILSERTAYTLAASAPSKFYQSNSRLDSASY